MKKIIILYVALMAIGLYAMPNTVSLFAGGHTILFYSGTGVECGRCHSDIFTQLQSGSSYEKHRAAAGNANYTTFLSIGGVSYAGGTIIDYNNTTWNWNSSVKAWQNSITGELKYVSLDKDNDGIQGNEICMLCHNATLTGSSAHTGIVVRACDDDRCHSNRINSYNPSQLLGSTAGITSAGYNLGQANVHQPFYLGASNQSSPYGANQAFGQPGNAYGSFVSRGYWTCEGCHTDAGVNATMVLAPEFNHSVSNPEKRRYN